jgi:hypothetical protein
MVDGPHRTHHPPDVGGNPKNVVCVAVAVAKREPHSLCRCSYLHSIWENRIGDEGAGYLGVALQVNVTLTMLM